MTLLDTYRWMGNASSIFYMVLGLRALEYKELPEVEELFIDKKKNRLGTKCKDLQENKGMCFLMPISP